MAQYRGLTWDHPRGRLALERAGAGASSQRGGALIEWDAHPLEGFESAPIDELAARYDVIVLDHPHLGDAIATGAIRPADEVFGAELLDSLEAGCVGPSFLSYVIDGRPWALPLDAATQVAVFRPDRLEAAPATWSEVVALSERVPVALSLAGPHALLSFASVCVALGEEPSVLPGSGFVSRATGREAVALLAEIAARAPEASVALNPIGLLERMRSVGDIAYIPLVYGYVNYASGPGALSFAEAPSAAAGGRRGSTIGGTGIAVTRRSEPDPVLIGHLSELFDPATQAGFIPQNAGQPSLASAWSDDGVNAASGDFYRRTRRTMADAWVRPRVAGYIPFQSHASAVLREVIANSAGDGQVDAALARIDALFDAITGPPAASGRIASSTSTRITAERSPA
ncbi:MULTISPECIES: extracellular solute-binding protein [unclassified Leifsonia]|uniref:extracellular solute-binding protein n=1 Tax=unclassified Leifsonia TaxID=2663824 RepID=UPI000B26CB42|nr:MULTISPECIES: extracellular solute-binding protein [unclassified Leifsonia]